MKALVYVNNFKDTVKIEYEDGTKRVFNNPTKQLPVELSEYLLDAKYNNYNVNEVYKWAIYKFEKGDERLRYLSPTIMVVVKQSQRLPDLGKGLKRIDKPILGKVNLPEMFLRKDFVWMVPIEVDLPHKI